MKHPRKIWENKSINEYFDAFPGMPVVEIAGDSRVLIENHECICEYSFEMICVKMKYGLLRIYGKNLRISKMTASQLVITGFIEDLQLHRGN